MTGPPRWRGWSELPYAHGGPPVSGKIRCQPDDFQVEELLGFTPEGAGEHAFVRIRKCGANTEWVARQLARFAGVSVKTVGYAGLKDRQAVTTQWFSIHLPGRPDPDISDRLSRHPTSSGHVDPPAHLPNDVDDSRSRRIQAHPLDVQIRVRQE